MPDINDTIGGYRQAVENLPEVKGDNEDLKLLEALLARDRVADELALAENKSPEVLVAIVEADELLKAKAAKVVDLIGATKLAAWRDARQNLLCDYQGEQGSIAGLFARKPLS